MLVVYVKDEVQFNGGFGKVLSAKKSKCEFGQNLGQASKSCEMSAKQFGEETTMRTCSCWKIHIIRVFLTEKGINTFFVGIDFGKILILIYFVITILKLLRK